MIVRPSDAGWEQERTFQVFACLCSARLPQKRTQASDPSSHLNCSIHFDRADSIAPVDCFSGRFLNRMTTCYYRFPFTLGKAENRVRLYRTSFRWLMRTASPMSCRLDGDLHGIRFLAEEQVQVARFLEPFDLDCETEIQPSIVTCPRKIKLAFRCCSRTDFRLLQHRRAFLRWRRTSRHGTDVSPRLRPGCDCRFMGGNRRLHTATHGQFL